MQKIVNHGCVAGVYKNIGFRYRWRQMVVSSRFNLLKKTKNVLGSKINNFHLSRF